MSKERYIINIISQFSDKEVEQEYYDEMISGTMNFFRYIILGMAVFYFALFIYNVMFSSFSNGNLMYVFICRVVPLLVAIYIFVTRNKVSKYNRSTNLIAIFALCIFISYLMILYLVVARSVLEESLAISIFMFCVFIFPHRWISLTVTVFSFAIVYFLFACFFMGEQAIDTLVQTAVYMTANAIFISLASYNLNRSNRERYAVSMQLLELTQTDPLTKINNRMRFDKSLANYLQLGKRYGHKFSVIMLDIDNFKQINDTFGHKSGDDILKILSATISKELRTEDIFARLGGEEFACILPYTDIVKAREVAERLRSIVELIEDPIVGHFTCSFGVTEYESTDDAEKIMHRVDTLMYEAKRQGKNRVM